MFFGTSLNSKTERRQWFDDKQLQDLYNDNYNRAPLSECLIGKSLSSEKIQWFDENQL